MPRYVDINELTREVLASVEVSTQKTASTPALLKTDIGVAIKHAANHIRDHVDNIVTHQDVTNLLNQGTKHAFSLAPLPPGGGGAMDPFTGIDQGARHLNNTLSPIIGMDARPIRGVTPVTPGAAPSPGVTPVTPGAAPSPGVTPVTPGAAAAPGTMPPTEPQPPQVRTASTLGEELRKVAIQIREQGERNEEIRLTKAAQMLTAAVGLNHLTTGLIKQSAVGSQALRGALIGSGVGTVAGGGIGYIGSREGEELEGILRGAAGGALAGGTVGGLHGGLKGLSQEMFHMPGGLPPHHPHAVPGYTDEFYRTLAEKVKADPARPILAPAAMGILGGGAAEYHLRPSKKKEKKEENE
jgi:hypothetical protein